MKKEGNGREFIVGGCEKEGSRMLEAIPEAAKWGKWRLIYAPAVAALGARSARYFPHGHNHPFRYFVSSLNIGFY